MQIVFCLEYPTSGYTLSIFNSNYKAVTHPFRYNLRLNKILHHFHCFRGKWINKCFEIAENCLTYLLQCDLKAISLQTATDSRLTTHPHTLHLLAKQWSRNEVNESNKIKSNILKVWLAYNLKECHMHSIIRREVFTGESLFAFHYNLRPISANLIHLFLCSQSLPQHRLHMLNA